MSGIDPHMNDAEYTEADSAAFRLSWLETELKRVRIQKDISDKLLKLYKGRWEKACEKYPDLKLPVVTRHPFGYKRREEP